MTPDRFVHYKVGIKIIDDEHFSLLKDMDHVIELAKEKKLAEACTKLAKVKSDLLDHFHREESYLQKINFPYLQAHIDDHVRMSRQLDKFDEICAGTYFISSSISIIIDDMEELFIKHIDNYDMQYAEEFKKHN